MDHLLQCTIPNESYNINLAESLYNFCSTLVAFRSFILCFLDGYNKALCNDELCLVKGGPASGSTILISIIMYNKALQFEICFAYS